MSIAIDIKALDPSSTNPRKTFGADGLEELADSIRSKGLLQPIIVRPSPKGGGRYEIVAGERRFRAAKLARLHEIEAIVRELSDEEVVEAQVIENGQREDVHPLEEAVGYQVLIEKHGRTVDDVAAKVGKSKAYVYGRLKLVSLGETARAAYLEGKLSHTAALYLARIPQAQQVEATEAVLEELEQYGNVTAAEISSLLQRRFMLRLKDAAFDTTDPGLVPGTPACDDCPKRTGNQRELFDDVAEDDTCTDAVCFQTKASAAFESKAAAARAKGVEVINEPETLRKLFEGNGHELRYNAPFVAVDGKHYDPTTGQQKSVRAIVGKDVAPVLLQAPDGSAVQAVPRRALEKALGREQPKKKRSQPSGGMTDSYARKRELDERIAAAVGTAVAAKWERTESLTPAFWRELARDAIDSMDHDGMFERRGIEAPRYGKESELISKLTITQIRGFVAEALFHRGLGFAGYSSAKMVATAKALGIDADPIIKREKEAAAAAAKAEKELAKAKAKKKGGKADGAKKDGAAKKPSKTASKKKSAKKARAERRVRAGVCRVCGCTDEFGCGACVWVEPDLCSACEPSSPDYEGP